jgi:hypothetical protein
MRRDPMARWSLSCCAFDNGRGALERFIERVFGRWGGGILIRGGVVPATALSFFVEFEREGRLRPRSNDDST